MSEKLLDEHGRWRNKIISFRMSPEEANLLDSYVSITGLTKQDYITSKLLNQPIIVIPNPRVIKYLKVGMDKLYNELIRIDDASEMTEEQICLLCFIAAIVRDIGGDNNDK